MLLCIALSLLCVYANAIHIVPACNSSIYCTGDLLKTVQLARIFPDAKTFVDLKIINSESETLANFANLMRETNNNPNREQITSFVDDNFVNGEEFEPWTPADFDPNPPMLREIADPKLRQFAQDVINIWPGLSRKVSKEVEPASREVLPEGKRENFYREMRSAAESGWDFSTRWFVTAKDQGIGNLTDVHTTSIVPVDLNAVFAGSLQQVGNLRSRLNDWPSAHKWWELARYWRDAIDNVLWDSSDGVWYDYDIKENMRRRHFYASCVTPLWAGAVEAADIPRYTPYFVKYLLNTSSLNFPGGIPTSLLNSGQQWDFPNAWPPLQGMMIYGLIQSGNSEAIKLARKQVPIWIRTNYIGYKKRQVMFEKYNALLPGDDGGGGEYTTQTGFGWTNGFLLDLLQRYGRYLMLVDNDEVLLV